MLLAKTIKVTFAQLQIADLMFLSCIPSPQSFPSKEFGKTLSGRVGLLE